MPDEALTFKLQLVESVPVEEMTLGQKREVAAKVIWQAHEQTRVNCKLGRAAAGGGLRKPRPSDIRALIRCAREIMEVENLDEGRAWRMLRSAAVCSVQAAAEARDNGDNRAERLSSWRRTDPFGGKKLGPMLAELEKRQAHNPPPEERERQEKTLKEQLEIAKKALT